MESLIHSSFSGKTARPFKMSMDSVENFQDLARIGYVLPENVVRQMMFAQDSLQSDITTPSISTPVQFLQNWLPGNVEVVTAARKIDEMIGVATTGSWEQEEVVQGLLELTGTSVPYTDYGNVPLSSWNINFERRTIVRFEEGMRVGNLEEARAAAMRVNSGQTKRDSSARALEIARNKTGFIGFNNGANRTYGFLNDPNLPGYVTVATGTGGTTWATKTFLEIQKDILTAIAALRNNSQDVIDPESVDLTLGLATAVVDYLAKTSDFGISVRQWMKETYPRIRVVSAPELNAANGGANVGYLFADSVSDSGSDDGRTWIQAVPARFVVTGVQKLAKGYEEDYSNATAGAMCKRPYAVYRFSGI